LRRQFGAARFAGAAQAGRERFWRAFDAARRPVDRGQSSMNGVPMSGEVLSLLGTMVLVFGVFLAPGLFSRRMEFSDYVTVTVLPLITLLAVIVPGMIRFGFNKNSATYLLGLVVVLAVATWNYRSQPKPTQVADPATTEE
jgi:hypothetical protein